MTAKKNNINNPQKKEIKEEKVIVEEPKKQEVKRHYKVKSEKDLGFKKRNYFAGGSKILIEADKEYSEDDYNKFPPKAKAIFFV